VARPLGTLLQHRQENSSKTLTKYFVRFMLMYTRPLLQSSPYDYYYSATGWKVGWAVGPENLVRAVTSVQQWVNFSAPTPNQDAMALSLEKAREPYKEYPSYYQFLAADYQRKRDLLANALRSAGMRPIIPLGGFFIMADTTSITEFPADKYRNEVTDAMPTNPMPRDWAMSRWMTQEVGVTAIPPSAFYDTQNIHLAQDLLRFAYCKGDETIMEAQRRFEVFFKNPDR
jgi:aspartate/methionine/tyrosine aminotransferase